MHLRDSNQFELVFKEMPWNGYSPRGLTKAFGSFSFIREGTGRLSQDASAEQLELFPEGTSYGT